MILQLEKRFNAMEEQRVALLHQLSKLVPAQLYYKPNPNSWSITETLHHLYLSELGAYKYMTKKLQQADTLPPTTWLHAIKTKLLKICLRSDLRFKVPAKAPVSPSSDISFGELVAQWNQLRKDFAALLDTIDAQTAKKQLFKHPVIGYMNAHQTLSFLQEHMNHHLKQLKRIRQHAGFPAVTATG